jgi:ribosomal protein L4
MFHGISDLDEHAMQGTACSDKRGEWTIAEAKSWKKT